MEREKLTRYLNRLEEVFQHMIRRLHAELAQSMVKGVTGSQFFVLKKIGDRGKLTVSEVAEDTGVSLSAITVLVDRLFKAGLVNRTRDDRDRRLVWLELTDEGEEILQMCRESRNRIIGRYFSQLPEGDIEKLIEIYERLMVIIQKDESRNREDN
ncbi:MAG: MarR family winged helix-turn-helix transcriptional regulator [Eubacteriales bacterium]